ncbi:MAG: adenosine deaminase [Ardenticatenaceae bacterium]|nr:adenosine deaminase [Ardenticatenaceae bacterium]
MSLDQFIRAMPKVELHVHLEGSIQPVTLLQLARRNHKTLPANTVDGLRRWYTFTDFDHFIEVYMTICSCIANAADFELIARQFLRGQAEQNIRYSEVIFTPYTHANGEHAIPFSDQLAALKRASKWAADELGITVAWVPDISRNTRPVEHSLTVADWAISGKEQGIIGFGVGGGEVGNPPELFEEAFDRARAAGLASLPHAGETEGPASIWGAIRSLGAVRIGHGVRCLDDPELVTYLRQHQIPLDVSPTSNVCLKVAPSLAEHPLPRLLDQGLYVTINSDDPPMFNTTLTDEYLAIAQTFGFDVDMIEKLVLNGVRASLQPVEVRSEMAHAFRDDFNRLRTQFGL